MFADACRCASRFTRPVIVSWRFFDRTTGCGCGAFIVVNAEGWIVTAAHLFRVHSSSQRHAQEIPRYFQRVHRILQNQALSDDEKRQKTLDLRTNPKWITNHTFWWGRDGVELKDVRFLPEGDVAIGRLEPFDPDPADIYPTFKDPANLSIGTSLCKLGYPFHVIDASFNEADGQFVLATDEQPLTSFPMEGIYTRTLAAGRSGDGKYAIKFLETSSPGVRGQSGGPIFDTRGTVWAVQSRTDMHPYEIPAGNGKTGRKDRDPRGVELGVGVHPEVLVSFLRDNGIRITVSGY